METETDMEMVKFPESSDSFFAAITISIKFIKICDTKPAGGGYIYWGQLEQLLNWKTGVIL